MAAAALYTANSMTSRIATVHSAKRINTPVINPGVEGLRFFSRGGAPLAAEEKKRQEFERKS